MVSCVVNVARMEAAAAEAEASQSPRNSRNRPPNAPIQLPSGIFSIIIIIHHICNLLLYVFDNNNFTVLIISSDLLQFNAQWFYVLYF